MFNSFILVIRNPAFGIDTWKPIPKNQDVNLTCLSINFPNEMSFGDISNPAINKFWERTLPYEYSMKNPEY